MATATAVVEALTDATASAVVIANGVPGVAYATVEASNALVKATALVTATAPGKATAVVTALPHNLFKRTDGVWRPATISRRTSSGLYIEGQPLRRIAGAWKGPRPVANRKPTLQGLSDRFQDPATVSTLYKDIVIDYLCMLHWADLQPNGPNDSINLAAPTYKGTTGPNQEGIKSGRTLDDEVKAARSSGRKLRLRVLCGHRAPTWAKNIGGAPMPWWDDTAVNATMGRWWHADYLAGYESLMTKLAAIYDDDPVIGDVVISGTMTIFSEPMIRQVGTPVDSTAQSHPNEWKPRLSLTAELKAGRYSRAIDIAATKRTVDIHAAAWKRTDSSLACNPYQFVELDVAGEPRVKTKDLLGSKEMMDYVAKVLTTRAVLGNHSIRDNQQTPPAGGSQEGYNQTLVGDLSKPLAGQLALYPMMATMRAEGKVGIYWQTDIPARNGRMCSPMPSPLTTVEVPYPGGNKLITGGPILDLCIFFGCSDVELPKFYEKSPPNYQSSFTSVAQAKAYDDAIRLL